MRQPLVVCPVGLDLAWNDPAANLAAMERAVDERLRGSKAGPEEHLFLFPELTLTGFVTKDPPAFGFDAPEIRRVSSLASSRRVAVAFGFPEVNPKGKPFNALALFGPDGKLVGRYRKMHLFTWGKNAESAGYSAGHGAVVFPYRGWKLGLAVCFDIRFPPLFHRYAKEGVDLLLVSSCWIGGPHKSYQYRTITSAHAILTQSFLAAVNRAGKDPFFEYDGAEYVFSPYGEQVAGGPDPGPGGRLDPVELEGARKLVVRPSDRESYPLA